MSRTLRHFVLSAGVTGVLLLAAAPCHADKMSDLKKEIADKKAVHAELTEKAKTLNAEVSTLKKDIMKVSGSLRASEESIAETNQRLELLEQKKSSYLNRLQTQHQEMDKLVTAARRYSQAEKPRLLIQNPVDAARASIVMKSMIPMIHQQSTQVQTRLAEVEKIQVQIAEQQKIQALLNKKLNKQQDELAALLVERNKLYESTESERQVQEKEMAALVKQSKNLEELMANVKNKALKAEKRVASNYTLPSNILLPVRGAIHTGFGEKDDLGAESKGVTFSARAGASVIVPLAGTVKFAGAFQNYKQILIVEHPGGYHSLIAGLARIDTVVGAALSAGEPIGVADTTDSPHVYYELRQNGKPVNPQKLLIAQRKQEKS